MKKRTKQISLGIATTALTTVIPVVAVVSCGINKNDFSTFYRFKRTEINKYGTIAPLNQRTFDPQYITGNTITDLFEGSTSGRSLPLLRSKATGDNVAKVNTNLAIKDPAKQITWIKTQKEEIEFQGAKAIYGSNDKNNWTEIKPTDIKPDGSTKAKYKFYKFVIRNVNWVDANNEKSKYKLNAKDYYYGMMRSLAASKSVRETGVLSGKKIPGLPKFNSTKDLNSNDRTINNPNSYLLDLFGIDVENTIKDGEKLKENDQDFVVSLHIASDQVLYSLFANNSYFSPAPSTKITEMAKGSSSPEVKYGITTYGQDGPSLSGIKDVLTVAPYFYSYYNFIDGYQLVKNNYYWDENFTKSKSKITKFTFHMTPEGSDPQANALARKTGYENGLESIFDETAWNNPEIQTKIRINADKYGAKLNKIYKVGLQNKLLWNPTMPQSIANEYNEKGIEAMYGKGITTRDQSLNMPKALNGFFNGNGMKVRKAMDAAYNWYAGAVAASGSTQKLALLSPLAPEQLTTTNSQTIWEIVEKNNKNPTTGSTKVDDSIWVKPTIVPSYKQMKEHYNNQNNEIAASTSPTFDAAKTLLDEVAKDIKATPSNPAIIPLQTWGAADKRKDSSEQIKQWETMIKIFNKASDGAIQFKRVVPGSWSTHLNNFQRNEAEFQYAAWGPDYPAASSSLQGILTIERAGILAGQMLDIKNQPQLKPVMDRYFNNYRINSNVLNTITAKDIYEMSRNSSSIKGDKRKLLNAAKEITSRGYLENASNDAFMKEAVTYIQNHAVYYRPIIKEKYSSLIADREMGGTTMEVHKSWLHKRALKNGLIFLQDYSVDLD